MCLSYPHGSRSPAIHSGSGARYITRLKLEGDLRVEISHWRFLDSWTSCAPWRTEEHKVVKLLASDASQSRWGATLSLPRGVEFTGDYFGEDLRGHDIAVKEAFALLKALQTLIFLAPSELAHGSEEDAEIKA